VIPLYQELNSRAQGEVSIREALRELELWGIGASFVFTEYQDSANKTLRLIKEWKDLLNEVMFDAVWSFVKTASILVELENSVNKNELNCS